MFWWNENKSRKYKEQYKNKLLFFPTTVDKLLKAKVYWKVIKNFSVLSHLDDNLVDDEIVNYMSVIFIVFK